MAAYLIARIEVTDPEQYARYQALAPAAIAAHGGEYIVRGGDVETLEGEEEIGRVVIVRFPDMGRARAFYDSTDYTEARAQRDGAAIGQFVIVDGV